MIRASDLIGCVVSTESGKRLGRVHDLRAHEHGGGWALMGLVIGGGGIRARLGGGVRAEPLRDGDLVAWEAITGIEPGSITVRDVIAPSIE